MEKINKNLSGFILTIHYLFLGNSYLSKLLFPKKITLKKPKSSNGTKILFLHHSTGKRIWDAGVKEWFNNYNKKNQTQYEIIEQDFPKREPYGWNNYPYDYWNIWVNHEGPEPFNNEPTLEMITKYYDVVILKHCFPVSNILNDTGSADVTSDEKRLENYKLQYKALKKKFYQYPNVKFIIWTIPALVKNHTTEENALRAHEFYQWVKDEWDEKDDNIYLWDFHILETKGTLYLTSENSVNKNNSHPNSSFSKNIAPNFCQRIVDIIEEKGDHTSITGNTIKLK